MMKNELILNKPNFSIFISTTKLSALQKKGLNIFLKNAEIELKTNKEIQELVKEVKGLEKELEKTTDFNKKYIVENELKKSDNELISKLGSFVKFEVEIDTVVDYAGSSNKNDDYIRDEMLKLKKLSVEIRNKKDWKSFEFFPFLEKKENLFIFEVSSELKKQMVLGRGYTPLDLLELRELTGKYAIIFYEIMKAYKFRGEIKLEMKELRKLTGTADLYNRKNGKIDFSVWETKVLKAGIDEINTKTDLKIKYDKIKIKGTIKQIYFFITKEKEMDEIIEIEENNYSEEILALYKVLPIEEQLETRKKEFKKLLKEHSYEMLEADIKYCKKNSKENFWAYFIKSINNGHYSAVELEKGKVKQELLEKQKLLEERKKELKKQEEIFLKEQAKEMFENLSENELNSYEKEYTKQEKMLKKFGVNLETFIISNLEDKFFTSSL